MHDLGRYYIVDGGGQSVAYTGTAGQVSNAVGAQTYNVSVVCTTAAYVVTGSAVATTADHYCAANEPYVFKIRPGQKVSAVQVSTGGTLYICELDS